MGSNSLFGNLNLNLLFGKEMSNFRTSVIDISDNNVSGAIDFSNVFIYESMKKLVILNLTNNKLSFQQSNISIRYCLTHSNSFRD